MSLKQKALIHRVYRHVRYANLKHQSINQGTGWPEGPAGNTPTEILPVDHIVHILVYLFVNYYQHSRKRPKASNDDCLQYEELDSCLVTSGKRDAGL